MSEIFKDEKWAATQLGETCGMPIIPSETDKALSRNTAHSMSRREQSSPKFQQTLVPCHGLASATAKDAIELYMPQHEELKPQVASCSEK